MAYEGGKILHGMERNELHECQTLSGSQTLLHGAFELLLYMKLILSFTGFRINLCAPVTSNEEMKLKGI